MNPGPNPTNPRPGSAPVLVLALAAAALGLAACGTGVRQSPAASEDTGTVRAVQAANSTYTTRSGDTPVSVAARPDVYSDPELWPLLKEANAEVLKGISPYGPIPADTVLVIPRGVSQERLEAARAEARRVAFERKRKGEVRRPTAEAAPLSPTVSAAQASPVASAASPSAAHAAASTTGAASPASPTTKAKAAGRGLPLTLLIVLVLAALAAVLVVFFRRDRKDFD